MPSPVLQMLDVQQQAELQQHQSPPQALVVDRSWNSSLGPGPGAYRHTNGIVTRLNRDDWMHHNEGASPDDEDDEHGPPHHHDHSMMEPVVNDATPESPAVLLLPHASSTSASGTTTLYSAELVTETPLVVAIPVTSRSLRQRLSETGKRLLDRVKSVGTRRRRRRPSSTDPMNSYVSDTDTDSPTVSPVPPSSELPGAYQVEPADSQHPDADDVLVVRAAPVDPSRAAKLRRLLRRLIRLRFELGENRAVVEAEVRVIQRRIDDAMMDVDAASGAAEVEVSPMVELNDSPWTTPDEVGVVMPEVTVAARDVDMTALDEAYARQFLHVSAATKAGKPDHSDEDAEAKRNAKEKIMWGRPPKRPLIDDDNDDDENDDNDAAATFDLPRANDSDPRASTEASSSAAPSQSAVADALQAALEENQRLRDVMERQHQEQQEKLRTVETEHQRLLDEKNSELEAIQQQLAASEDELRSVTVELASKTHELVSVERELVETKAIGEQRLEQQRSEHQERVRGLEATIAAHQPYRTEMADAEDKMRAMSSDLQAAQAEIMSLREELQASCQANSALLECEREWDEAEAEFERRIDDLSGQIESLGAVNRQLHGQCWRRLRTREDVTGRKRRRIHSSCSGQRNENSSASGCGNCCSLTNAGVLENCGCDEVAMASSRELVSDDTSSSTSLMSRTHPVTTTPGRQRQHWSEPGIQIVSKLCRFLHRKRILADAYLGDDAVPEFPYPFLPEEMMWAEAVALCSAWSFPTGAPADTMERVTVGVVRKLCECGDSVFRLRRIACFRSSIVISTEVTIRDPHSNKPVPLPVEILVALVDKESQLCVDTASMSSETQQRLVVCAKGFLVDNGVEIRRGGLDQILSSIRATMGEGLDRSRDVVCPMCLQSRHPHQAATWNYERVKTASSESLHCRYGHHMSTKLICGPRFTCTQAPSTKRLKTPDDLMALSQYRRSTVVIAAHNPVTLQREEVGSGFIADRSQGLILTAAHVVMKKSRVLWWPVYRQIEIGIAREDGDGVDFCYRAEIVPTGSSSVDACVLRITGRIPDNSGPKDRSSRCLVPPELPLADDSFWGENVQLVGYNQAGEGKYSPGRYLDLEPDVLRGFFCKKFKHQASGSSQREEIVIEGGQAFQGHSGGPCVNSRGEVLGLLSRTDCFYGRRWYLVPFTDLRPLLDAARGRF